MPHLRFTRDHRGYENTFLLETVRRRGREQSRILYWFRTPPQVKVGRSAIDEDAIRALEDAYPGVEFDWNRILEAHPPEPEPVSDDPRRRPRGKGGRERERGPRRDSKPERQGRQEPPPPPPPRSSRSAPPPEDAAAAIPAEPLPAEVAPEPAARVVEPEDDVQLAPLPVAVTADEPEDADGSELPAPEAHASEPSAAERMLGSEALLRLRARHAEVCARIGAQVADPERQEALRTLAERLNPDAWVTEPDVRAGLEQFEQVLDQVRREVGPLRKRTRRGGRRNRRRRENQAGAAAATPGLSSPPTDEPLDGGPDDEGGGDEA